MNRFVVDCSVTMAWCLRDEAAAYADTLLSKLAGAMAFVPSVWPLEVANVLLVAERRRRLAKADTLRSLELLGQLPITIDQETANRALGPILTLARDHDLSAYDAAYLELAMRDGLPLATQDEALRKAARAVGVPLVTM